MDEYLSDREQAERIKKWWLENYRVLLVGVVTALVIIGGWRYWQHRVYTRSVAASVLYQKLADAITGGNYADAVKAADQLTGKYDDTPYAVQGALAMGAFDVQSNKPDDAAKNLGWAIQHAHDADLVLLAKLRLAQVKLTMGDPKAALKTLDVKDARGFVPLYDDARGDAYAKLGQTDKARAAYKDALAKWSDELGDKSMVQMKLNALASTQPAAGAKTK